MTHNRFRDIFWWYFLNFFTAVAVLSHMVSRMSAFVENLVTTTLLSPILRVMKTKALTYWNFKKDKKNRKKQDENKNKWKKQDENKNKWKKQGRTNGQNKAQQKTA